MEYMENYALRVRPLLDVTEVSVIMITALITLLLAHSRTALIAVITQREPGLAGRPVDPDCCKMSETFLHFWTYHCC